MENKLAALQDEVLDFLLEYRAKEDGSLRFVLNTNERSHLEAGNWLPYFDSGDYLLLIFWQGPPRFVFRIYADGRAGLYLEAGRGIKEAQKEALAEAFSNYKDFSKGDKPDSPKFYSLGRLAPESWKADLRAFLDDDRRRIDEVVQHSPAAGSTPSLHTINGYTTFSHLNGMAHFDEISFSVRLATVAQFRQKRETEKTFGPILSGGPGTANPPMAIESFRFKKFQGIEETAIMQLPRAQWIFLTGNNGYGKTTILRAIFVGLFGAKDGDKVLANGQSQIALRYWNRSTITVSNTAAPSAAANVPKAVLAYGSARLNITGNISASEESEKNAPSYSLFNTDGILLSIETELKTWHHERRERFDNVVQALKRLMPNIGDIRYDSKSVPPRIVYRENESSEDMDFNKLAAGYKSIIAIVGDMLTRLFRANPNKNTPKDLEAIVILDEIELHLHPTWQRKLPSLLSEVFPKMQFIAATHSPIIISGAPPGSVFLNVERHANTGMEVKRLDVDVSALLPNAILTSQIFGFQDIFPEQFEGGQPQKRIRTEDFHDDIKFNDEVKARLQKFAGSPEEDELSNLF